MRKQKPEKRNKTHKTDKIVVTHYGRHRTAQTKGTTNKPTTKGYCFVSNKVEN